MITIENSKIFIDGKEVIDPVSIGYAVLDFVENAKTSSAKEFTLTELLNEELKVEYFNLVDRKTQEREIIIDFILKENEFEGVKNVFDKFKKEHRLMISHGTFYNTINSMVEHGILLKVPQKFKVNR